MTMMYVASRIETQVVALLAVRIESSAAPLAHYYLIGMFGIGIIPSLSYDVRCIMYYGARFVALFRKNFT